MIACHKCGYALDFSGQVCPRCGSRLIFCKESILALDGIKLKKKNKKVFWSKSKKDVYEERTDKWEIFRKTGELQHTVRVEDRLNDQYYEHIETPDGETILHVEQPLHEHYGHGSAKKKVKESQIDNLEIEIPDLI